jgi:5-hydroxyisourate hydrolase
MSTLTTHVLDTSLGRPAEGVRVTLMRGDATLGSGVTDADGRARELLHGGGTLERGSYRLVFHVDEYFARGKRRAFYPRIAVDFLVDGENEHYHVPLLLSPFGYSTYRGS